MLIYHIHKHSYQLETGKVDSIWGSIKKKKKKPLKTQPNYQNIRARKWSCKSYEKLENEIIENY